VTRKATISILVAVAALLVAWDVWVYLEPTGGDTISEVTLGFARRHPVLPFAIGVVCGHLFWSQRPKE
jgi:hypothetical protein